MTAAFRKSCAPRAPGTAVPFFTLRASSGVGVEKDPQKAMDALEAAAETDCGAACVEYGMALVDGRYGETDDVTGKKFLEKAVRLADPDTYADLGRILTGGVLGAGRLPMISACFSRPAKRIPGP